MAKIFESFEEHLENVNEGKIHNSVTIVPEDEKYEKSWVHNRGGYVGAAGVRKPRLIDFMLIPLDDFDKSVIAKSPKAKVGKDEFVFRYETETTKAGGMKPFIKINVARCMLYFLTEASYDDDVTEFEKKGQKAEWIVIDEKGVSEYTYKG